MKKFNLRILALAVMATALIGFSGIANAGMGNGSPCGYNQNLTPEQQTKMQNMHTQFSAATETTRQQLIMKRVIFLFAAVMIWFSEAMASAMLTLRGPEAQAVSRSTAATMLSLVVSFMGCLIHCVGNFEVGQSCFLGGLNHPVMC